MRVTAAVNSAKKKPAMPVLPTRRTMAAMRMGTIVTILSVATISSGSSIFRNSVFLLFFCDVLSSTYSAKFDGDVSTIRHTKYLAMVRTPNVKEDKELERQEENKETVMVRERKTMKRSQRISNCIQ